MMRKRFLLSALLLFALVLAPSLSLADDGFWVSAGGSFDGDYGVKYTAVTHDGGWTGFFVKAADSWSAAVYACGGDPARISANVRSKLSDPNYGGAFYMYATNYAHIMSVYEIPEFVPLYVLAGLGISSVWHGDFGDMMLWYADTPNSLLDSALIDFRRVLAGEDLSGGSEFSGTFLELSAIPCNSTSEHAILPPDRHVERAIVATFVDGSLSVGTDGAWFTCWLNSTYHVPSMTLYVSEYVQSLADDYLSQGFDVSYYYNHGTCGLVIGHDLQVVSYSETDLEGYLSNRNGLQSSDDLIEISLPMDSRYWDDSVRLPFVVFPSSGTPSQTVYPSRTTWSYVSSPISRPDGDWPETDTPVTPDPPDIPTPTEPTVTPDPEPTAPSITWPTSPTLVLPSAPVVETTPEGNDYTSLLMLINDNLNSIDSYLQTFYSSFNGFRSDFLAGVDAIVGSLRNIYQYLGHLSDILEVHCKHIRDSIDDNFYELELYLKGLFQWLPEQLNFDSVYDDSAVVDWLRQIYYKLGGGTYAPNPVADPGGFFGWLGGLVAGFLASLLAGLPGKIQELLSDLSDLTGYFPFSAPWDLYALLALFSHDPVTPVFTLPWGLGGGHTANVVVDCSQWDGVMSIVRSVEKIIFAGGLAKLTFDMFKPTDVTGD